MKNLKRLIIAAIIAFYSVTLFGQPLKGGSIAGIHEFIVTLNENVTQVQFEKFFHDEFVPAYEKNYPDVKLFLLKGERGMNKGNYGMLYLFKSAEARDTWYPLPDVSSEKSKAAYEKFKPYVDKLNEYAKTIEATYTDWQIL